MEILREEAEAVEIPVMKLVAICMRNYTFSL